MGMLGQVNKVLSKIKTTRPSQSTKRIALACPSSFPSSPRTHSKIGNPCQKSGRIAPWLCRSGISSSRWLASDGCIIGIRIIVRPRHRTNRHSIIQLSWFMHFLGGLYLYLLLVCSRAVDQRSWLFLRDRQHLNCQSIFYLFPRLVLLLVAGRVSEYAGCCAPREIAPG